MPKHSSQILEMARKGAEHRWHELQAELNQLVKAFPHLNALSKGGRASAGREGRQAEAPAGLHGAQSQDGQVSRRPRMSAAARKAASERMKKYWAERRRAKAAGAKK